jgi:polysaccharide export outer membrane protein
MMRTIKSGTCVLLLCGLTACPSQTPKPAPPAIGLTDDSVVQALWRERMSGGVRTEPCLGPGDLLEISVFHWPDLQNYRTRVSSTGNISLPLLGAMHVAGMTESELRDKIADGLRHSIMRDPQVSVFVAEYVSQQVSVTGAVARPGLFGLNRDHRTIADMISEAGGFDEHAGGRISITPAMGSSCDGSARPMLQPASATTAEPIEFDVNEQYASAQANPLLLPVVGGDAIVVNRGRFSVDGWVKTPGAYDIAPGMTAMGGISAAGGAEFAGDMNHVTVWRTQRGGTKKKIEVNMDDVAKGAGKDVTLQAGDVIEVPASSAKMVPYSAYWALTTIVKIGAYVPLAI